MSMYPFPIRSSTPWIYNRNNSIRFLVAKRSIDKKFDIENTSSILWSHCEIYEELNSCEISRMKWKRARESRWHTGASQYRMDKYIVSIYTVMLICQHKNTCTHTLTQTHINIDRWLYFRRFNIFFFNKKGKVMLTGTRECVYISVRRRWRLTRITLPRIHTFSWIHLKIALIWFHIKLCWRIFQI